MIVQPSGKLNLIHIDDRAIDIATLYRNVAEYLGEHLGVTEVFFLPDFDEFALDDVDGFRERLNALNPGGALRLRVNTEITVHNGDVRREPYTSYPKKLVDDIVTSAEQLGGPLAVLVDVRLTGFDDHALAAEGVPRWTNIGFWVANEVVHRIGDRLDTRVLLYSRTPAMDRVEEIDSRIRLVSKEDPVRLNSMLAETLRGTTTGAVPQPGAKTTDEAERALTTLGRVVDLLSKLRKLFSPL